MGGMRIVLLAAMMAAIGGPLAAAECRVPPLPVCAGCSPALDITIRRDGSCRVRLSVTGASAAATEPAPKQIDLRVKVRLADATPARSRRTARARAPALPRRACFTYNGLEFCE